MECTATHTGTDKPLCCIPSQQAEVSLASADAGLHHCVRAASEGAAGEAYAGCGECEVQPMCYVLVQIAAADGIRTWRPKAANAQVEKNTDKSKTYLLTPIPFLVPTIHVFIFAIFPFRIRVTRDTILDPPDDPEDGLLPQSLFYASPYHVPYGMRDTHGLPVPNVGTGS